MHAAATKDTAKALHNRICKGASNNTMIIYTDRSGIANKVGAATFNPTSNKASHQHLSSNAQYNVYAAEMTALDMAITTSQSQVKEHPKCYIFTDSQAAGTSISQPRRQSGQAIIHSTIDRIDSIMSKHTRQQPELEIIWIPGYHEIAGNKRVDSEAKHAATNFTLSQQFKQKPLKSSRVQYIKDAAKKQWQKEWAENTKTGTHFRRITRRGNYGPKLYNQINSRCTTTQIAQLRTGHCGLNKCLHRFGRRSSPYCKCGYGKETVEHYLMEC
jgi:ribonuclease HI